MRHAPLEQKKLTWALACRQSPQLQRTDIDEYISQEGGRL